MGVCREVLGMEHRIYCVGKEPLCFSAVIHCCPMGSFFSFETWLKSERAVSASVGVTDNRWGVRHAAAEIWNYRVVERCYPQRTGMTLASYVLSYTQTQGPKIRRKYRRADVANAIASPHSRWRSYSLFWSSLPASSSWVERSRWWFLSSV